MMFSSLGVITKLIFFPDIFKSLVEKRKVGGGKCFSGAKTFAKSFLGAFLLDIYLLGLSRDESGSQGQAWR